MKSKDKGRSLSTAIALNKCFFGALALLFAWARWDSKNSSHDIPLGDILTFFIIVLLFAAIVFSVVTYMLLLLMIDDENVLFWTLWPLFVSVSFSTLLFGALLVFPWAFFLFAIPVAFITPYMFCIFKAH